MDISLSESLKKKYFLQWSDISLPKTTGINHDFQNEDFSKINIGDSIYVNNMMGAHKIIQSYSDYFSDADLAFLANKKEYLGEQSKITCLKSFNLADKDREKDYLPEDKPRYLMGVGTPSDILGAVKRGIDMFDCVMPTRSGRTGLAFTWNGRINIRNSKYQNDNTPLDENCKNFSLNKYSKNYLNHLFNTNEILGSMILTLNNINFYQELMSEIRKNINDGTFEEFHNKYINKL